MSYHMARECFAENKKLIGEPMSNPLQWNLNNGLENLATAIENDLANIQNALHAIVQALNRR